MIAMRVGSAPQSPTATWRSYRGTRSTLIRPTMSGHRFTFNGNYQLPFGRGRALMNRSHWGDEVAGGWSTALTFAAQTGTPFSVSPDISTAAGGSVRAIKTRDPFATGGAADTVNNPGVTCATKTKTKEHWYNPCAFA